MTKHSTLAFRARATGDGLLLIVRLDHQEIWRGTLEQEFVRIQHVFDDTADLDHLLEIEMQHKISEHTRVDAEGNILEDRVIEIRDLSFEDIPLTPPLVGIAEYHNDVNGTQSHRIDKFYGNMGCNGIVKIEFSSPVYLWLLENM